MLARVPRAVISVELEQGREEVHAIDGQVGLSQASIQRFNCLIEVEDSLGDSQVGVLLSLSYVLGDSIEIKQWRIEVALEALLQAGFMSLLLG